MPVNRRSKPEAEKRAQLIEAAQLLFVQDGYEATSINRISQAAQVTPNTIYWYFKDKDELLVAVLQALQQENLVAYGEQAAHCSVEQQLIWFVERLRPLRGLVATVHNRIGESEAVRNWHAQFHQLFEGLFVRAIEPRWSKSQLAAEILIGSFTLEGLIAHDVDADATHCTCVALAARWRHPNDV